jgi:hypothetical protein
MLNSPSPEDLATLDLDRLERLERAATPLQWRATQGVKVGYLHRIGSHGPRIAKCYLGQTEEERDGMPDAEFLAELRNSCTALIARARKADQLEAQLPDAVREVTVAAINGVGGVLAQQRDDARAEAKRLRETLTAQREMLKRIRLEVVAHFSDQEWIAAGSPTPKTTADRVYGIATAAEVFTREALGLLPGDEGTR